MNRECCSKVWLKRTELFFSLLLVCSFSIAAEDAVTQATSLELTAEEQTWLSAHPVIRLSAESDWPPYEFADANGKLQGMTADYLELISEMLGVHFSIETQPPWKEKQERLRNRKLDAVLFVNKTSEREKFLDFTHPYFISPIVIVSRKDQNVTTLDDPALKTAAVESGYAVESYLHENYPQLDLITASGTTEALEAVSNGQAQIYVGDRAVVTHLIDRDLLTNLRISARASFPESVFRIGVRQDWPMLTQVMQKALSRISDAQHQSIRRKWIPVEDTTSFPDVPLTREEQEWLQSHPVIRVGGESNWPPYDFVDEQGQHTGAAADIMKTLGNRLGVRFEVVADLPWTTMLEAVRSGELNATVAITQTPSRQKDFIFTTAYVLSPVGIVTRNDTTQIKSLSDLASRRIAIPDGYADIELLRSRYPGFKHIKVDSILEALEAVKNKRADAFVGSTEVAAYLIDRNNLSDLRFAAYDIPLRSNDIHIGISRQQPLLASILQKTLNSISTEEIDVILKRWVTNIESAKITASRVVLSNPEQSRLSENPVVRFTGDPNWLPFESFNTNGEYIGIVSEVVKLIELRTGIQFDRVPSDSWLDAVKMANQEEVDIISGDLADTAIQKTHQFTQPYLEQPMAIVMRDEQRDYISDFYEIADKRIAIIEGYGYTFDVFEMYPDIDFIKVKNIQEALLGLSTGSTDAFLGSFNLISYHINQMGLTNLRIVGQVPINIRIGLGVRKDMPELLSILNKAITTLTAAEKFQITESWMQDKYIKRMDNTPWLRALAAASLILMLFLLLFFVWNRLLQEQVRKRTASLYQSRESLAQAQRIAHLGNWEWDFKSDEVTWSDEVFRIFGYQPAAVQPTGALFTNHLSHNDDRKVLRAVKTILDSKQIKEVAFRVRRIDDKIRHVKVQAQPVSKQEKITGLFGTIQDITAQYNIEKALRESESRYRHFFENNTAGILNIEHRPPISTSLSVKEQIELIFKNSYAAETNTVYTEMLGYASPEGYLGERFGLHIDRTDPVNLTAIEAFVKADYKADGALIHSKTVYGKDIYLLTNAIGLIKDGSLQSTWISSTNITPRLEAEHALRDSEEKFSKAFASSPDAIIFSSLREGCYLDINDSFEKLSGYSRQEVLGRTPIEIGLWTDEKQIEEFRDRLRTDRGVRDQEITFRTKSGETRIGLLTGGLIELKEQICMVSVIRDITDKVQLEQRNREQELQLLQANKMTAIGTLVAGVAHEINNPNQLIQINTEILGKAWPDIERRLRTSDITNDNIGGLPENEMRETIPVLLQDISEASIRINRIVNDLKDFSRPQNENVETDFDINAAASRALNLLNHFIHKKTENFTTDLASDIPDISGNRQYFEQIVVNLLTNALESLPDNTHGVSVATQFNSAEQQLLLVIKDQGCGIKPEHLDKLFDPFFTTRQSQGGTGLGLAITYNLVRQFSGEIKIDSKPGSGTTISVIFPVKNS